MMFIYENNVFHIYRTTHQLIIEMSNNCVRIAFKKYYSFVNIMIKSFDKKVPTHHL